MVLENSKEVLENKGTDFLDTYVSKLIDVLIKYKELKKEIPEGYEGLLEFISIVMNTINGFLEEDELQREIDFSTDVKALLTSTKSIGLSPEKSTTLYQ